MTSVQRLLLVADLILLTKKKALTLDLDIIVLLLGRTLAKTTAATDASIRTDFLSITGGIGATKLVISSIAVGTGISDILALLLFLLFFLLAPHLVDIEELNCDIVTLKGAVPIFATTNEDVGIQIVSSHIGIGTVLFVDAQNTSDQLSIAEECRQVCLGKVRSEKGLPLLLLLLLLLLDICGGACWLA
jgi:hypothetical protein